MDKRVDYVQEHIKNNLAEQQEVTDLAKLVNVSPSRLGHIFKIQTGLTINQYIRELRLIKARELLKTSFLTVKQVACKGGFRHQSKFSSYFKEKYGISPKIYKNWTNEN